MDIHRGTAAGPGRLKRARAAVITWSNRFAPRTMATLGDGVKRLIVRPLTVDGNTLDPTLRLAIAMQNLVRAEGLSSGGDPVTCRRRYRDNLLAIDVKPIPVGGVADLSIPGPAGGIPARHFRPAIDGAAPMLVYFHGGGWVLGDLDAHDRLYRSICSGAGVHVLAVDYRLAPEHPVPAGLEDCYAAYRWAVAHGADLGAEAGLVAVGGESAGGNLAAVTARLARDDGIPPTLQLLIYPVTDISSTRRSYELFGTRLLLTRRDMEWFGACYLAGSDLAADDPLVSPLLLDDMTGLPRALVVTAGFDVLRDEGDAYAEAMRAAGVRVDHRRMSSLAHGFVTLTSFGGGSAAGLAEINSALRAHLCYR